MTPETIIKKSLSEHGNVKCSKCNAELCLDRKITPEKLENAGWGISGKVVVCKKCIVKKKFKI